jgi:hypothetical protein
MQRINQWSGLRTQSSPYAIPPGGAQQQVNFVLLSPGQIVSRGGMSGTTFLRGRMPAGVAEQVFPITGGMGNPDRMLVIDSTGAVALVDGPRL